MSKVITGDEVKRIIKEGVDYVANPVGSSMGAKGRFTLINLPNVAPTKDGVTIAKNIAPKGDLEPVVKVMHDAARRSVSIAGDGTSATNVLAQALVTKGLDAVLGLSTNPIDVKRGIDLAVSKVVEYVKSHSIDVSEDYEKLRQVAIISANNDEEMGNLIADAVKGVGIHGVVDVNNSKTTETYIEFSSGLEFENGYIVSHLINTTKNTSDTRDPYILITGDSIVEFKDIAIAWEMAAKAQRPLVVIAGDVKGQALATVISNLTTEGLPYINLVKAPQMGSLKEDFLDDLAIITGGKVMSKSRGNNLSELTVEDLGQADRVISTKKTTSIIGGKGNKQAVEERAELVTNMLEDEMTDEDKRILKSRVAKLVGGSATIFVGAASESERKEKLDRIDDSLRAVGSAVKEGINVGGGVALLNAEKSLEGLEMPNKDVNIGIGIVRDSLKANISKILGNAGLDAEPIIEEIRSKGNDFGYNLEKGEITDLIKDGVIDASLVITTSLQSAASVAGILLMTENIIVDE